MDKHTNVSVNVAGIFSCCSPYGRVVNPSDKGT